MSDIADTPAKLAAYIKCAEDAGHGIVFGGPRYLQLDLDSEERYDVAINQIERFKQNLPVDSIWESVSRGGNWHVHIFLTEDMARRDRVFWQLALGSDMVRESLYWLRLNNEQDDEAFFVECTGHKVTQLYPPIAEKPIGLQMGR